MKKAIFTEGLKGGLFFVLIDLRRKQVHEVTFLFKDLAVKRLRNSSVLKIAEA